MLHLLLTLVTVASLWAWAVAHQLVIGWVVANMIERLPAPDANSSKTYAYVYSVLQFFLAANSKRAQDAIAVVQKP